MASRQPVTEDDLSCSVCQDIFKDPVFLSCSHSFCRTCIECTWKKDTTLRCPICRRRSSKSDPPCNLVLKNLCEAFSQEACLKDAVPEVPCSLHDEKLTLFCQVDRQTVCVKCLTEKHKDHRFCSITEAARPHKEALMTLLKRLKEKQKLFCQFSQTFDKTNEYIKQQEQHTERVIKQQFEELHQFLRDEEAVRIAALKVEKEQKSALMTEKMEEMAKEISSLSDTISTITQLIGTADILFLKNYMATVAGTTSMPLDPQMVPGSLINVVNHLGSLKYRVWEKMLGIVQYTPVTLDPNTADVKLLISEDLTTVRENVYNQQLPDNPERITAYSGVLGSEGFTAGKHSWDVAIGDDDDWIVGVVKESINRKEFCVASPENGFWVIWMSNGECKALTSPPTGLTNKKFKKIRVQLNYDKGKVIFLDITNNVPLYTFKQKFTERVFPYFYRNGKNPLRIQPVQRALL